MSPDELQFFEQLREYSLPRLPD